MASNADGAGAARSSNSPYETEVSDHICPLPPPHEPPHLRKVLDCASPLALSNGGCGSKSARGLAQSKTLARYR